MEYQSEIFTDDVSWVYLVECQRSRSWVKRSKFTGGKRGHFSPFSALKKNSGHTVRPRELKFWIQDHNRNKKTQEIKFLFIFIFDVEMEEK